MGFIPGYDYDIFISYAHIDNVAFPGQQEGWIAEFYKNLNLMLAKRFGRMDMVKIWWDNHKLDGTVLFDKSIEEGIRNSAIMICLNSPGYMASDYCRKELELFEEKVKQEKTGIHTGDRSRIVHVLLNNIPHQKWHPALSGTTGFPFYSSGTDDFGETVDTLSGDFRRQMQLLRNSLWSLLTGLNETLTAHATEPKASTKDEKPFTIYLGEVADTLRRPRMRIISELEKKGFKVLNGIPPPHDAVSHEIASAQAIENADLAIHLLDEFPGSPILDEEDNWYPQKQTQLALKSSKSQMIWVPPDLDYDTIEDENYKLFLQNLEVGHDTKKEFEFVRCSKNTLVQEIADLAEEIKLRSIKVKPDNGKISVLLDTHFNDQIYALDLCKNLIENQVQPYINALDDDPRKNTGLLAERISEVKKLIFMYGAVSKEWVRERMSAALQLIVSNNFPVEDFYIYMAPPHKEDSEISMNQKFLKVSIFNNSNSQFIEPAVLHQFIHDLKSRTA